MKKILVKLTVLAVLFSCTKNDKFSKESNLQLERIEDEKVSLMKDSVREADKTLTSQLPVNTHINEEIEKHLNEVLEPVRNRLREVIESDGTGNFKRYEEAALYARSLKDAKLQRQAIERMRKEFYPFIKELWEKAAIDEEKYQHAILGIFPENIRKGVQFQEFLNFTMGPSEKPEPPVPPAPAPATTQPTSAPAPVAQPVPSQPQVSGQQKT